MTPRQFDRFYDSRVEARQQIYSRERVWDRATEPTLVVSALLILGTVLYNSYGPRLGIDLAVCTTARASWNIFVHLFPVWLLDLISGWLDPAATQPMFATSHAAKSERMRSLFGLSQAGDMMKSVLDARRATFSATTNALGFKADSELPPGLGNRDNSCYQNSILQGLASLQTLPPYLSATLKVVEEGGDGDVTETLRSLLSELNDTTNYGRTLWAPKLLKSMSTWTQQDAQEYYSKILEDIDKQIAKASKAPRRHAGFESEGERDDSDGSQHSQDSGYQSLSSTSNNLVAKAVRNPLEGFLAQRVACVQCGYSEGLSMNPFNCLTLNLGVENREHDLYELLDSFSKVEWIEGVECPKCTLLKAQRLLTRLVDKFRDNKAPEEQLAEPVRRLNAVDLALEEDDFDDKTIREECKITPQGKVQTTKTKQIVIARPPQSLAIHMQRSVFDETTFSMMKNSAPVNFPLTLDLGPWCLGSAADKDVTSATSASTSQEIWGLEPEQSMIAGDGRPSRVTGPIYELRAAVTHYGRHENGHYVCYRRFPQRRRSARSKEATKEASEETGETTKEAIDADDPKDALEDLGEEAIGDDSKEVEDVEEAVDWWRLSDQVVTKVREENIMGLAPGVFMLFYDCVDPSMVVQTDDAAVDAQEHQAPAPDEAQSTGSPAENEQGIPEPLEARNAPSPPEAQSQAATEATEARSEEDTKQSA